MKRLGVSRMHSGAAELIRNRCPRPVDRLVQGLPTPGFEPDPAEITRRYGARRPHRVTDLAGGRCRIAPGIRVTNADRTAL
jgi:hypothetical protein